MHFVHCERNQIVAESAILLLFFDILCCFGFHNKYFKPCTTQNCSKIGEFAESATVFAESRTVCGIHKQILRHEYSYIELLRNPQLKAESANCKWNSHFVCGFHLKLLISLTFWEFHLHFTESAYSCSRTTSYICLLRNPQQKNVPTKFP